MTLLIALLLFPDFLKATGKQIDFLLDGVHDNSNNQLTSGWIYSYSAGTTNTKSIYTDAALTVAHSNPAQLDSYGRLQAWGNGKYKFIIKNSDLATIYTIDGLEYTSVNTLASTTTDPFGTTLTQTNLTVHNLTASLAANLNANGKKIINLASGTISSDAINLGQLISSLTSTLASATIQDASTLASATIQDASTLASAAINASAACVYTVPTGIITMWYGTEANVPSGWHLCDGASGTPDLRGWFIRSSYDTNVPVGSWTSSYAISFDRASSTYECPMTSYASGTPGTGELLPIGSDTYSLGTYTAGLNHIGGYYALAYIMKL